MKATMRKTIIASALCGACLSPSMALAYGCPPYNTAVQVAETTTLEVALSTMWSTLMTTLQKTLLSFDRQEIGAMKVLAAQISTAAKAEVKAKQAIGDARVASLSYLESTKEQMRVFRQFSPQTGQGVDPCSQINAQSMVAISRHLAQETARDFVRQTAAAPGRYGDPASYFRKQMQVRAQYATSNDEKLGMGKANKDVVILKDGTPFPLAGADSNGSVLFADSTDSRVTAAKRAFLDNLAGPPITPIPNQFSDSPAARDYLMTKARKEALSSAALYSLSTIAAENTPSNNTPSTMGALRDVRDLYFGPKALPRWAAWSVQDARGLQIDRLKVESAQLAAKEQAYKSGQRMEMLLGTLVVARAGENGDLIAFHAAQAAKNTMQSPVN